MFNTMIPIFRYWKIKIPIYSLYKKKLSSQQRTVFYTEKVDKRVRKEEKDRYTVAHTSECASTDWEKRGREKYSEEGFGVMGSRGDVIVNGHLCGISLCPLLGYSVMFCSVGQVLCCDAPH